MPGQETPQVTERPSRYALKTLQKARTADATTSCRLQPHLGCAVGRAEGHHVRICLLCVCEEQQGGGHPARTRPEALISLRFLVFSLSLPGLLANRSKGFLALLTLATKGIGHWGALCAFSEFLVVPRPVLVSIRRPLPHPIIVISVSHVGTCRRSGSARSWLLPPRQVALPRQVAVRRGSNDLPASHCGCHTLASVPVSV